MNRALPITSFIISFLLSFVSFSFAGNTTRCDFETELSKIYNDAADKRVSLAIQQNQVLDKMEKLIEHLPDNGKPVSDLISKEDLANFQKLRERSMTLVAASLSESKRMRDMQFFKKFVILAEKDVRWPEIPSSDHPDFVPYALLESARQFLQDKVEITEGSIYDKCCLESSIQIMEQEVIDKINSMDAAPISEFNDLYSKLVKKYKMQGLDPNEMTKEDVIAFQTALEKIEPIKKLMTLVKDYEILKLLVKASHLIYEHDKEDILILGADSDKIGTTILDKTNSGQYGEAMRDAHAFMRVMNNRIPCDDFNEIDKIYKNVIK